MDKWLISGQAIFVLSYFCDRKEKFHFQHVVHIEGLQFLNFLIFMTEIKVKFNAFTIYEST